MIYKKIKDIIISPTEKTIIFQDINDDWFFMNADGSSKTSLIKFIPQEVSKIVFDNRNKNIFYFLNEQGVYSADLSLETKKLILTGNIIDFTLQKNDIIYIENTKESSLLSRIDIRKPNQIINLSTLPISQKYIFYESPDEIVNFVDATHDIFYLFDFDLKIFDDKKMIIPDVKEITWHNNGRSFLFSNNNEIWVYRKEENKYSKKLITRLSTPIEKAMWFNADTHVIYFNDDKIYIKETISDNPFLIEYSNNTKTKQAFLWEDKIMTVSETGVETFLIQ